MIPSALTDIKPPCYYFKIPILYHRSFKILVGIDINKLGVRVHWHCMLHRWLVHSPVEDPMGPPICRTLEMQRAAIDND
jgi:hypothetical protein